MPKVKKPSEDEILAAILQVKPTADMPRQGAHPAKEGHKQRGKALHLQFFPGVFPVELPVPQFHRN